MAVDSLQSPPGIDALPERRTVLLVGNPNVGKSVLFRNLTQRYVTVSNFPGTTVEIARARAIFDGSTGGHDVEVIDTPGINDISPRAEDARVTREMIDRNPDATLVQVADAKNLRRALLLTLQLSELGRPMVLVLNMMDELEQRGGRIDTARLSRLLGVPVLTTVALRNRGTADVIAALSGSPETEPSIPLLQDQLRVPGAADGPDADHNSDYERNRARLALIHEILARTYSMQRPRHAAFAVRLGFWAMHPVKGLALLAVVLAAVFWFVGLFGAGTMVDLFETGIFRQHVNPMAIRAADAVLPFPHTHAVETVEASVGLPLTPIHEVSLGSFEKATILPEYTLSTPSGPIGLDDLTVGQKVLRFVHDGLVGEYGLITMALSYALAIVFPIVTTFFLLFSILEDSGYLPRMSIMVNRVFRFMGLNGKAVLPMILGLGCDTMATMTTRVLETRKERIVTTMLLALAVPCSAQLGVLLAMMAALTPAGALAWVALIVGVIFLVGWLTAKVFGGEDAGDFILEIPPMRRPQAGNVAIKTVSRLNWYLREVIPLFMVGTAGLFVLDQVGALATIAAWGEPLVTGWLGLPAKMSNAFLVGFMRRDFGAVYLLEAATGPSPELSPHQILVAMVTITLFMPCIANFLMIAKEHGMRVAWAMAAFIFPFAFFVGGIVHRVSGWLIGS
ncbi:MAG: ferrous iron transporter B [Acidobacteriota bacterium]|jgi:ferrous iron transport protein B